MRIVAIEELKKGDKVVIQTGIDTVEVQTVEGVYIDDLLIITEESFPMDLSVDDKVMILDDTYNGA